MTLKFPDLSHYKTGVDVARYPALITKATEGTGMVDSSFSGYRKAAAAAGIPFLPYHFLHHGDITAQVNHVLDVVGARTLMLDVESEPNAQLTLLMEADAEGMAQLTQMRAGTTKFCRIKCVSPTLAGSATQFYELDIDTAIKVADVGDFSDEDGVYAIEWTFDIVYDGTWGKAFDVNLWNKETTL